eukprot:COSAG01_NODE_4391_length_5072_cov_2.913533_8_plen_32_part_01
MHLHTTLHAETTNMALDADESGTVELEELKQC